MLKEYLLEAASLLAEAVFGTPVHAEASCHPCGSFWQWGASNCGACGAEKRIYYRVYKCGNDFYWCADHCDYC
jgi:hypothetical protein